MASVLPLETLHGGIVWGHAVVGTCSAGQWVWLESRCRQGEKGRPWREASAPGREAASAPGATGLKQGLCPRSERQSEL